MIAAIIRHGDYYQLPETPSAHQPFQLNKDGIKHAEQAALQLNEIIRQHGWHLFPVIDSSKLLRAWQTADIIGKKLAPMLKQNIKTESFEELAERGLGCAANLTVNQIEQIIQVDPRFPAPPDNWKADSHYRLPLQGAESLLDAGKRVAEHIEKRMDLLFQQECNHNTLKLFIGHGAAFRHAAYRLGVLTFKQIDKLSMYHGQPVFFEYNYNQGWQHIGGRWKVRNREQHLD